jgi:hypothetical protein
MEDAKDVVMEKLEDMKVKSKRAVRDFGKSFEKFKLNIGSGVLQSTLQSAKDDIRKGKK